MKQFEQIDVDKINKAKSLLIEVLSYYYGAPGYAAQIKRLETIIGKIEALENL